MKSIKYFIKAIKQADTINELKILSVSILGVGDLSRVQKENLIVSIALKQRTILDKG